MGYASPYCLNLIVVLLIAGQLGHCVTAISRMKQPVTFLHTIGDRLLGKSPIQPVLWLVIGSALLFLIASSARHILFQSGAFDLGYFDQAIYLISQGEAPVVSFWGFHFLGGHADWMVYPLALLYRLHASVYWLFAVQAIALAAGAIPTYYLARQAGLKESQSTTLAIVYLLYPLVFNLNLFDFHPEVMALPLLLTAVLAARSHQIGWFTLCTVIILGCRDALSLTVAMMGVWLWFFEKRRICGAIAVGSGTLWFLIAIKFVIPAFRPAGVEAALRYDYLGDSVLAIAKNMVLRPDLVLGRVFALPTLEYLLLVTVPVLWGLSIRHLAPLVVAIPTLAMNILSNAPSQRDLVHQYSLPILPFLLLSVIAAIAAHATWIRHQRLILVWSLVTFLALAKYGYFGSLYLRSLDTWSATREAVALVQTKGSVLTTHAIVPHLTQRSQIRFTLADAPLPDLTQFEYVLLDTQHPGWRSTPEFAHALVGQLQQHPQFQLHYQRDGVYLFNQRDTTNG